MITALVIAVIVLAILYLCGRGVVAMEAQEKQNQNYLQPRDGES
ncbi:MAG: hypothetical protein WBK91_03900 [Alphaproteobacteria bacterium]